MSTEEQKPTEAIVAEEVKGEETKEETKHDVQYEDEDTKAKVRPFIPIQHLFVAKLGGSLAGFELRGCGK